MLNLTLNYQLAALFTDDSLFFSIVSQSVENHRVKTSPFYRNLWHFDTWGREHTKK